MEFCALGEKNGYKYEKYQDTALFGYIPPIFYFHPRQGKPSPGTEEFEDD